MELAIDFFCFHCEVLKIKKHNFLALGLSKTMFKWFVKNEN